MKYLPILLSLLVVGKVHAAESLARAAMAANPSPREDLVLSAGWRFIQEDVKGAEAPEFSDGSWQTVRVPHCWNIKPGQDGDKANFYEGPGWYRLRIRPDAATAGKSLFLKFDAAYHSAEVFLNGKAIGSHIGGFGAFCFDVTGLLRPGQENLLAVRVSFRPSMPSIPLAGDYTKYPGLYREVHLLVLDPVSISPLDDASSGVYLKQAQVDAAAARVEVTAKLRNGTAEAKSVTVRCRILDAQGAEVQSTSAEQSIAARGAVDSVQALTLTKPHLWNGRSDPYLYHAEVEVADNNGIRDRLSQPLGLRSFRADAERGFFLNGQAYAVHGVCRHQDRFDRGWAISKADMAEDLALLLEMGCTGVRLAHYPHSGVFHDLCDQAGVLVWAELPFIGGGWNVQIKSGAFADNVCQQLTELIKQNYNHPSIMFWSIWNEIGSAKTESDKEFLSELNLLAKRLDPTRLTTAASADDKNKTTEVVGRNAYPGWYGGTPDDWSRDLPLIRSKTGGRPLIISEYGSGASVLQHQVNPRGVSPKGLFHPEQWQTEIHEKAWNVFRNAPYLCATFVWQGFDCSSMVRNEGDHPGRNDKGLITSDRSIRKDAFYFYKANWNPEPMVYITSRRFTPRPSGVFPVKAYSNCGEVELFIEGRSQGCLTNETDGAYVWDHVLLPEGQVHVAVVARRAGKAVKDKCIWKCSTDAPAKLDLSGRANLPNAGHPKSRAGVSSDTPSWLSSRRQGALPELRSSVVESVW
jgi:beta-galactosidase